MSRIAGTIIFTRDDMSYFLVVDDTVDFYTVKMHRHNEDTALGTLLTGFKNELGIDVDNLRLGELAGWTKQGVDEQAELISLYTFEVVDPQKMDLNRLELLGMHFASAREVATLLQHVDMMTVAQLD
jgi:hypothetical protein